MRTSGRAGEARGRGHRDGGGHGGSPGREPRCGGVPAIDSPASRAMIGPARLGSQTGDPWREKRTGSRAFIDHGVDDDAFVRCVWSIKKPTSTVRATARMYNEGGVGSRAPPPRPAGRARPFPPPRPSQPKDLCPPPSPSPIAKLPPSSPVAKGRPTAHPPPPTGRVPRFTRRLRQHPSPDTDAPALFLLTR